MKSFFSMTCPHCGERARVRSGEQITPLYRELRFQCSNVECGYTFVGGLEVLRTLSPSGCPNPAIHIPADTRRVAG